MEHKPLKIDVPLVQRLVATQFPKWKDLPIWPVVLSGWDNRTFHLGKEMLVRMPSAVRYEAKVEKEQRWLPILAPFLPLPIPKPLGLGMPGAGYPWKWSIYRWLEGETAAAAPVHDLHRFAIDLAHFLAALQRIDTTDGPLPGPHNFYRGGSLMTYDEETRTAMIALRGKLDTKTATEVWATALGAAWQKPPVWVHGDISAGNLIVQEGKLSAVIDFGGLAIGDPACDLAIAWTFFQGENRVAFRKELPLDEGTWARGRAWTLWKALIVAAGLADSNNTESRQCWRIIEDVLAG